MVSKVTPSTPNALELCQSYAPLVEKYKYDIFFFDEDMAEKTFNLPKVHPRTPRILRLPGVIEEYGISLLHIAVLYGRLKGCLNMVWELIQQGYPVDLPATKTYSYSCRSTGQIAFPVESTAYDYAMARDMEIAVLLKLNGGTSSSLATRNCFMGDGEVEKAILENQIEFFKYFPSEIASDLPQKVGETIADYAYKIEF